MAFKKYVASAQGYRAQADNCIAVGKSRIGLGNFKDIPAIMFARGDTGNGFKVTKAVHGKTTYLAAKSFTDRGYVPLGVYRRTDDKAEVFKLVEPLEETA